MDQVIFDSANVLYLAANLPEGAEDRVGVEGWSIWQTVLHMAVESAGYGQEIAWLRDETHSNPVADSIDRGTYIGGRASMSTLVADMLHFRAGFLAELAKTALDVLLRGNPEADFESPLKQWPRHYFEHGLSMVEILPEFWDDAITLTWVFEADLSFAPALAGRQAVLLKRVQAYLTEREVAEAAAKKGKKR